ncbi:MAG: NADH dehydrogenase subunit [Ignavibacteria bacterium]|nr:NADH dehydrogenase subunit [Ignavibacteria bacterium]
MSLTEKIFNAGVVGAGGAGFPTHIKAKSKIEYVIVNGAECEPLIHKDFVMMVNFPDEIVNGVNEMINSTQAKKSFFGIKAKNSEAIFAIEKSIANSKIELCQLGDFYPSGDEYELVYAATKRLIPPHGLPLDVSCVVNNVETFYNITQAIKNKPVTHKLVSVSGAVKKPSTFFVPIGTSFKELIEHCGGASISDFGVFVSGILMGNLTFNLNEVVTKTTAGLIILPMEHYLVDRQKRPIKDMNRIGKSACDQCSYCTEFCPRYLLGYDVQPHKVMRSLGFTASGEAVWNKFADLCCSCGLCSLYACPEDLYPREACDQGKVYLKQKNEKYYQPKEVKVHPMKEGRRVPLKMLLKKLDLVRFDAHTPFNKKPVEPGVVKIFLKQHIGKSATPIVSIGENVKEGQLIGDVSVNELGAKIHASINGRITHVSDEFIRISK